MLKRLIYVCPKFAYFKTNKLLIKHALVDTVLPFSVATRLRYVVKEANVLAPCHIFDRFAVKRVVNQLV